MKHWKLLLIIGLITSCGQLGLQAPNNSRLSALEASHSGQLTDTDLAKHVQSKLNDLHLLQLGAYEDLESFDSTLSTNWKGLTENIPYSKILAAKVRIDEIQAEIFGLQDELLSSSQDEKIELDQKLKSILSLQHTLPQANQTKGAWEYSLWNIHQHNKSLAKQLILAQGKTSNPELQNAYEKIYLIIKKNHGAFYDGSPSFVEWKNIIHKEQNATRKLESTDRIVKSVEHLAHEIRFEFQKMNKQVNNLDEAGIRPSIGHAGNVTGNEFPAKVWSLTFNAGPVSGLTKKTVNQLSKLGQKGTFFQAVELAKKNSHSARYVRTSGMEIGSQANLRLAVGNLSQEEREEQIQDITLELASLHPESSIRFYRLPHASGISQRDIRVRIAKLGMIHAFWNIDALDWQIQPAADIANRVIKQMENTKSESGVVVFNEGLEQTLEASNVVMSYLKKKNNRVCSLGEIVTQMNANLAVCPVKVNITSN